MNDLAQVILAIATLVSAVATLAVSVGMSFRVAETHQLVNGQSEALRQLRENVGEKRGFELGLQATKTTEPPEYPSTGSSATS